MAQNNQHNITDPVERVIVDYMRAEVQHGHLEHSLNDIKDGLKKRQKPAPLPSEAEILKALGRLEAQNIIGTRVTWSKKKNRQRTKYYLKDLPSNHTDNEEATDDKREE